MSHYSRNERPSESFRSSALDRHDRLLMRQPEPDDKPVNWDWPSLFLADLRAANALDRKPANADDSWWNWIDELDANMTSSSSSSSSSSWKASFMSTRERFLNSAGRPIELKLGGQPTVKKPTSMTTSDDWSSFEKLFGESKSSVHNRRFASASPTPRPEMDNGIVKEIENRCMALNELIRGIAMLGTGTSNGVGRDVQSPTQSSSTFGSMPNRPTKFQKSWSPTVSNIGSASNGTVMDSGMVNGNSLALHTNGNGVASHGNDSVSNSNSSMALQIIDEVQQFLQANTDSVTRRNGRFPQPLSPGTPTTPNTPTSPTTKSFSGLSDQLTRQVVDDRYPVSLGGAGNAKKTSFDNHRFNRTSFSQRVTTGSVAERVNQFEHSRQQNGSQPNTNSSRPLFFHFQLPSSIANAAASVVHQPTVVTAVATPSSALSTKFQQNSSDFLPSPTVAEPPDEVLAEITKNGESLKDLQNGVLSAASERPEFVNDSDFELNGQRRRVDVLNRIEKALQELPDNTPQTLTPLFDKSEGINGTATRNEELDLHKPVTNGCLSKSEELILPEETVDHKPLIKSTDAAELTIAKTVPIFRALAGGKAELSEFGQICRACGLPACCRRALFEACRGQKNFVVQFDLTKFWNSLGDQTGDESVVFVRLLSSSASNYRYLVPDDFYEMIQEIVDEHPGLAFLREAPEFHSRYVQTVISRIFFVVNRSWSGKITAAEVRRSNLLAILHRLDEEEDINRITDYFSYEHFYVIYCKFWELDRDHDLFIDKDDVARFDNCALSKRAIDRIFSPALNNDRRLLEENRMSYPQFVRFILAEKDKSHPTSIEYWFRCMDLDGDGIISLYEMQHFYEDQADKMITCGIEPMPFVDILCQILDIVHPRDTTKITLSDLKRCKMAPVFYDTFLNLARYLEREQTESGGGLSVRGGPEGDNEVINDWIAYAAEEYEALVAEEADLGTEIKCDDSEDEEI